LNSLTAANFDLRMCRKTGVDRYIGCLMGGAVGDALGAPIEFQRLSSILQTFGPEGLRKYVEYEDGTGSITDDTQMMLFTAEGLLRARHRLALRGTWEGYDHICYTAYQRWLYTQGETCLKSSTSAPKRDGWLVNLPQLHQRRAPGNTCLSALISGRPGTIDNPINNSKGCGGVMRIAPVGLLLHSDATLAFRTGAELAAMTHGHPSGYLSSGVLAAIICRLNQGAGLMDAIEDSIHLLRSYKSHEETLGAITAAIGLSGKGNPSFESVETLGGGWVGEEALAIALYCALSHPNDFERAIILAINHSGDTDSTGAIAGNIVGMMLGEQAIPERWIARLRERDIVRQMAIDLHTEIRGDAHDSDVDWMTRYPPY
jgi:ADP-ribosylglycohydrolase